MIRPFPLCRRCGCIVNRDNAMYVCRRWWHPHCWAAHERDVLAAAMRELTK